MTSIITFLIVISFLIFIHELVHLLAAKWANVKVEAFSIGFGKKLITFKYGETEYSLSMLPLGGYVKMHGEESLSDDSNPNEHPQIEEDRSYKNLPNYKKQIILFAGPLMNLLIPFIFFPIIHLSGIEMPKFLDEVPVVGYYENKSENSFFQENDLILKINGRDVETWKSLLENKNSFVNNKQEIIVTFLGILELMRLKLMRVQQSQHFETIRIYKSADQKTQDDILQEYHRTLDADSLESS